jgi:hypothetical protein
MNYLPVTENDGHFHYCRNSEGALSYNHSSHSFHGTVGILELTDMPENETVEEKARRKRIRREPRVAESTEAETGVKTARKQADFLENERQGLNRDPAGEHQVRNTRKERELPGGKGGIDDLDKQFTDRVRTIKRDIRIQMSSGGIEMKGPKLDEKKEQEINEEKKGNIPQVPKGNEDILEPARFSDEDQGALEKEVRKIRKDQPEK